MSSPVLTPAARPHVSGRQPGLLAAPRQHFFLIAQLTRREVVGRYRGSHLGIFWSFVNPVLLLCIYTLVFKYIFHSRFTGHVDESPADFPLALFSALIVFNLFAECLNRAPSLILLNSNYVTKVVFPLEVLPLTVVFGSLVHLLIGFFPLVLATLIARGGHLHPTVALWPLLLVPISAWALSLTWLVTAAGAFLRDLSEVMAALTQILMYASAVFYPIQGLDEHVPPVVKTIIALNPLAFFSEQSRKPHGLGRGDGLEGVRVDDRVRGRGDDAELQDLHERQAGVRRRGLTRGGFRTLFLDEARRGSSVLPAHASSARPMQLSIITPLFNRLELTRACIESLRSTTGGWIMNGSSSTTAAPTAPVTSCARCPTTGVSAWC